MTNATVAEIAEAVRPFPLDARCVAALIGIPLDQWPGNCHAIAHAIRVKLPVKGMRVMRGHWTGPTHPDSVYRSGFQQHTWLELADGRILDPTRWAFTEPGTPSIYIGAADHYDFASLEVNRFMMRGLGPQHASSNPFVPMIEELSESEQAEFSRLLGLGGRADATRIAVAFNAIRQRHPDQVDNVQAIYRFADAHDLSGFLPMDCVVMVLEPHEIESQSEDGIWYELTAQEERISAFELVAGLLSKFTDPDHNADAASILDELGLSTDEYREALEQLTRMVMDDGNNPVIPEQYHFVLGIGVTSVLGSGFGQVAKIEEHADALGYGLDDLRKSVEAFGSLCGVDASW